MRIDSDYTVGRMSVVNFVVEVIFLINERNDKT